MYPFSSDQGSQAGLGSTSIQLSDRPETLGAVVFGLLLLCPARSNQAVVGAMLLMLLVCISASDPW